MIEIQERAEMETASHGIYVSSSGLLPDTGGIEGSNYIEYQSVRRAKVFFHQWLPMSMEIRTCILIPIFCCLANEATEDGKLFIPVVKGPNVLSHGPHIMKRGYVIAFLPYIYTIGGRGEIKQYKMPVGWKNSWVIKRK
jgi:hypothetical protein